MNFKYIARKVKYGLHPRLYWANTGFPNWGDDLNPWLFTKLTKKQPIYCPHPDIARLFMVGSILGQAGAKDSCWGSGFISAKPQREPKLKKAFTLRGPLSGELINSAGIHDPEIYGDPGLLACDFIEHSLTKSYKYAVVPHYIDFKRGSAFASQISGKLIPVSLPIEEFVQTLSKAEIVFSSSLHGLICAESLQIPAIWVKFSDDIVGGVFKFHDYLGGTGRDYSGAQPFDLTASMTDPKQLAKKHVWEKFDLEGVKSRLISSFPYPIHLQNS